MNFSVTTTEKNGILQACERYTRIGDATISGTAAYLAEFTNYCNETLREVWPLIFKSYGGWQYEDGNQTDLPASVATLTSGQTSYALPSLALTVKGIEVKDAGGNWLALKPITEDQIRNQVNIGNTSGQIYNQLNGQALGEFLDTPGTPLYYQLVGQTVKIFPASSWTQASSFKVFYDRGSVAFLTTDTTKTPGFAYEFHDIVPLGASCLWFEINSPEDLAYQVLKQKFERKKVELEIFYSSQSKRLMKPKLTTRNIYDR
jgi:hypothetical protein